VLITVSPITVTLLIFHSGVTLPPLWRVLPHWRVSTPLEGVTPGGCYPAPFLPVRPRLSTILYKFAHNIFSFGCHPPGGCPGRPPPVTPLAFPLNFLRHFRSWWTYVIEDFLSYGQHISTCLPVLVNNLNIWMHCYHFYQLIPPQFEQFTSAYYEIHKLFVTKTDRFPSQSTEYNSVSVICELSRYLVLADTAACSAL